MTTTLGEAASRVLTMTPRPWDGKTITEPGAYSGVNLANYHGNPKLFDGPAISSSGLRTIFSESPAHYWDGSIYNPDRQTKEPTEAMILGSAVHKIISREMGFEDEFCVRPEEWSDWRSGASQAWRKQMTALGRQVLTPEAMEKVNGMVKSVQSSPFYNDLHEGMPEVSIFYRDEKTGIWIKARPDNALSDWSIGLDLKCTFSVFPRQLSFAMEDRQYVMQAAVIREAIKQAVGADMSSFGFLFVESSRPHCARMEEVFPDDMDLAADAVRASLDVFKRCWDTGAWPGPENPTGDGGYFRLSETARARIMNRIELLQRMAA